MMPIEREALVQHATRSYRRRLLMRQGVTMVRSGFKVTGGQRTDIPAVIIAVRSKQPKSALAAEEVLPERLEINGQSVATDVVEAEFKALEDPERIRRVRPAPGGVSIGHVDVTAGTLSCVLKRNGTPVILSNAHVLAMSGQAEFGDPIVQPGPYDGGTEGADTIGTLEAFVPITFESGGGLPDLPDCPTATKIVRGLNWLAKTLGRHTRFTLVPKAAAMNVVDAAVAMPLQPWEQEVIQAILAKDGEWVEVEGIRAASIGMSVWKAGRTTGYTAGGTITATDAAVRVSYGELGEAIFENQIVVESTERFSQGGDSGSCVLEDRYAVGLLFAGDEPGTMTICCPMTEVARLLELSV